jgi:site-specific recombinase XerD
VISPLEKLYQMMAKLLYGSGIRLIACLRLRVKDSEFERSQIMVCDTKGNEDRVTKKRVTSGNWLLLTWKALRIPRYGALFNLTSPFLPAPSCAV